MKKLTFKEFLIEAPINDYQTIGNWDKNSSFRDKRDRAIIRHPKAIERVRKKFGNTDFDFNFFFVNSPKADKHTEVGVVAPDWVKQNLGDEVYKAIEPYLGSDHINVIFTNNKGSERMPMTAWMMAHRLGHAMANEEGREEHWTQYRAASNHLMSSFSGLMDYYHYTHDTPDSHEKMRGFAMDRREKITIREKQLMMLQFFYQVATFRSARDKNIRNWFEILNELIAQYLTTGRIKFNAAPKMFGNQRRRWYLKQGGEEEASESLQTLARDMQIMIDDCLFSMVNSVLVM